MAQSHGNARIVQDGLVFSVDAKNTRNNSADVLDFANKNIGVLTGGCDWDVNRQIWELDGIDDYIDFGNISEIDSINDTISVECWVYYTGIDESVGIVDKGRDAFGAWSLAHSVGSSYIFKVRVNGSNTITTFPRVSDEWVHIVGTYDGTSNKIYKNGILMDTDSSQSGGVGTNAIGLTIGIYNDFFNFFGGKISNVKIYDRALSQAEIESNYNNSKHRFENEILDNLVLNLNSRTGDVGGTAWSDLSVSQNDGVLTNGVDFDLLDVNFDGVDDYVLVSDDSTLQFGTNPFTISMWVKDTYNGGDFRWCLSKYSNADNNGFRMGYWNDRKWVFRDRNTGVNIFSPDTVVANVWHNIIWVREGTGANETKFYLNGEFNTQSTSAGNMNNTSDVYVGAPNPLAGHGTDEWSGSISMTKVYNRALSATEALQEYDATSHRFRNLD